MTFASVTQPGERTIERLSSSSVRLRGRNPLGPDVDSGGLIRPMKCVGTERSFFPEPGRRTEETDEL